MGDMQQLSLMLTWPSLCWTEWLGAQQEEWEHQLGGGGRRKEAFFLISKFQVCYLIVFILFSPETCCKVGLIIYSLKIKKKKKIETRMKRPIKNLKPGQCDSKAMPLLLLSCKVVTKQERHLQVSRSESYHCNTRFALTRRPLSATVPAICFLCPACRGTILEVLML